MNNTNRKKVLFFLPSGVGGAEHMTVTIAKMLPQEKFEAKFIIVGKNKGNIATIIPQDYGCDLLRLNTIWEFATLRMATIMKREKPQCVFCSMRYLNSRLIAAARLVGGIKVIVRNDNSLEGLRWDKFLLMKWTYPYANIIIAQQEEMRLQIIEVLHLPEEKVIVRHNPLDTKAIDKKAEASSPYPADKNIIKYVWVGRFSHDKGQDVVVRAFQKVQAANNDAHLYLIGNNTSEKTYTKKIIDFIQQNHLVENIHLIGFDSNPYKWIKHADCFVMPSRREGLPNALIEAMYLGKPVVSTRCLPIIDRMVREGYNGYVVDVNDTVAMARRMQDALMLRDFSMTYQPASNQDFIKLFC